LFGNINLHDLRHQLKNYKMKFDVEHARLDKRIKTWK